MGEYVGHYVQCRGQKVEVVGYSKDPDSDNSCLLIVDGASLGGHSWTSLGPNDVIFKDCESYYYVLVYDLIVLKN